jgi:hypothetical protein
VIVAPPGLFTGEPVFTGGVPGLFGWLGLMGVLGVRRCIGFDTVSPILAGDVILLLLLLMPPIESLLGCCGVCAWICVLHINKAVAAYSSFFIVCCVFISILLYNRAGLTKDSVLVYAKCLIYSFPTNTPPVAATHPKSSLSI